MLSPVVKRPTASEKSPILRSAAVQRLIHDYYARDIVLFRDAKMRVSPWHLASPKNQSQGPASV